MMKIFRKPLDRDATSQIENVQSLGKLQFIVIQISDMLFVRLKKHANKFFYFLYGEGCFFRKQKLSQIA